MERKKNTPPSKSPRTPFKPDRNALANKRIWRDKDLDARPNYRERWGQQEQVPDDSHLPTRSLLTKRPDAEAANPHPRLNKFIANAGICSRRKADEHIEQGLVMVNNIVIKEMGYRVLPNDEVRFKGEVVKIEEKKVYILLNKPKDTITTLSDPQGRRTVMDVVKNVCPQRVYPVGRLDRDTTGLLLLTNDGDLSKKLMHPSHRIPKIYEARLNKPLTPKDLQAIANGLTLDDGEVKVEWVRYLEDGNKKEVQLEIHIGRNRIVRRIFEHLGYDVLKLDRTYYAGLTKRDVPRGKYRLLTPQEIILLKHFV